MVRLNKLYFTLIFFSYILSAFPSVLVFSNGPCQSTGTVTVAILFFEMGEVIKMNYWHVEPAFDFYSHRLSDYWSKQSKVLIR